MQWLAGLFFYGSAATDFNESLPQHGDILRSNHRIVPPHNTFGQTCYGNIAHQNYYDRSPIRDIAKSGVGYLTSFPGIWRLHVQLRALCSTLYPYSRT